ncbi:MAG: PilZ domain-containing protein [Nitrospira sp.]|nr:PilZ domain-containing protein [Nitrospira sp.]
MIKQGALLNKRAHIRHYLQTEIQYVIESQSDQFLKGILTDISDRGLSLCVFQPLPEGQIIMIKSDSRDLNKRAMVRWCRELGDNIYRTGVMFVR